MANVKTAISLQKSLFEQAEALACEMKISRSRLVAIALEEFIRRRQNQELLDKINAAYEEPLDEEEQSVLRAMRRHQRQLAEN